MPGLFLRVILVAAILPSERSRTAPDAIEQTGESLFLRDPIEKSSRIDTKGRLDVSLAHDADRALQFDSGFW